MSAVGHAKTNDNVKRTIHDNKGQQHTKNNKGIVEGEFKILNSVQYSLRVLMAYFHNLEEKKTRTKGGIKGNIT